MLYRKKLNMDEPSNVLDSSLDYIDSSTERVKKWLCNNRKVEQQSTKERNTPKRMLTVQLPIRLFNSFKQLLLIQETAVRLCNILIARPLPGSPYRAFVIQHQYETNNLLMLLF